MTPTGSKNQEGGKSKDGPRLPWWVELLFVQIGLPDKWLASFLRSKNNSTKALKNNKKKLSYLFILIVGVLYTQPYSTYFNRHSNCFVYKLNQISANTKDNNLDIKESKAKALNYCNGGLSNFNN
tara:strand:- start:693 stop:1067 length:375 start_codon:yes stop_codon:yes gene_type:complete